MRKRDDGVAGSGLIGAICLTWTSAKILKRVLQLALVQ